jgi:uncharacterized membrane protein YphA (DoxX/SURF4 family)
MAETFEASALVFRFGLASVFLFAGLAKLPRREEFVHVVRRYRLGPSRLTQPVARWLPWFEIACAVLLFVGLATRAAASAVGAALLLFVCAVAINLLRGREIDCGCSSTSFATTISWSLVVRDLLLTAAAVFIAVRAPTLLSLDGLVLGRDGGLSSGDGIALLVGSTTAVAVAAVVRDALALRGIVLRRARGEPAA